MPPCAQVCLTATGKHSSTVSGQRVLSFLKGSEGQFEKIPCANLRNSGRRHFSSLFSLGGGGDGQKAGNGSPSPSTVFQSETASLISKVVSSHNKTFCMQKVNNQRIDQLIN